MADAKEKPPTLLCVTHNGTDPSVPLSPSSGISPRRTDALVAWERPQGDDSRPSLAASRSSVISPQPGQGLFHAENTPAQCSTPPTSPPPPPRPRFRGNSLLPQSHPTLVKKGRHYVASGWPRYENNLMAVVGFLEFAGAFDWPANVFNSLPVKTFVKALMGLGFSVAIIWAGFAIMDMIRSYANIVVLFKERRYLKSWRQRITTRVGVAPVSRPVTDDDDVRNIEQGRTSNTLDSEVLLAAILDCSVREVGWEIADRFAMDFFCGVSLFIVGPGTLLAIWGADPRLFEISNLLSGYIGNSFPAAYVFINASWSIYMWKRANQHSKAINRLQGYSKIEPRVTKRVTTHSARHKTYALVNGLTVFVAAIGALISATMWQGYVILIPCVIGSAFANFFWRHKLGYCRDSVETWIDINNFDVLDRLKTVIDMHQTLTRASEKSTEILQHDWANNSDVIEFLQENGLYRDFCAILLKHPADAKKILGGQLGEMIVADPERILAADHSVVTAAARECIRTVGRRRLRDEERYLLELLGCYLVQREKTSRPSKAIEMRSRAVTAETKRAEEVETSTQTSRQGVEDV